METSNLLASHPSAASNGGANDTNKFPFAKLSRMWQRANRNDLKLRHLTGAWLNVQHGAPTQRQPYGEGTLQQYKEKLGVSESDVSRMRWFAHYFPSLEDLKKEAPTATTWTKVKEVIARRRHPQDVPVVKRPSDEKKLVVADRPVDQLIEVMRSIHSHAVKVGKLTANGVEWKAVREAFEGVLKDVGASLGYRFMFPDDPMSGQPVASSATTELAEQARMLTFESASPLELPAVVFGPADNGQFKPLLQR